METLKWIGEYEHTGIEEGIWKYWNRKRIGKPGIEGNMETLE